MKPARTRTVMLAGSRAAAPPTAGAFMASPRGGAVVFRVESVVTVHAAGGRTAPRYRLLCTPLAAPDVPSGADVMPWRLADPAKRPPALTADPGPGEDALARLDRIRFKAPLLLLQAVAAVRASRAADATEQMARAARVGRDAGKQPGRDLGHGIRLVDIRGGVGRKRILRPADVLTAEEPDPDRPNRTVRRTRRTDPLKRLWDERTITGREYDAAELLRGHLQGLEPAMVGGFGGGVSVPAHQRNPISERQLTSGIQARRAMAVINPADKPVVMWVLMGGTISGFSRFARSHNQTVAAHLKHGLAHLADYYFGARSAPAPNGGRHGQRSQAQG